MCPQLSGDSPVCSACVHLLLDREESFDTGLRGAGCQKSFYERVHLMGRLSPVACHEFLPIPSHQAPHEDQTDMPW